MKPAQTAKAEGLNSITEMAEISGTEVRTLQNWHKRKHRLFIAIAKGCVVIKSEASNITKQGE